MKFLSVLSHINEYHLNICLLFIPDLRILQLDKIIKNLICLNSLKSLYYINKCDKIQFKIFLAWKALKRLFVR